MVSKDHFTTAKAGMFWLLLVSLFLCFASFASTAEAREVITLQNCDKCQYTVVAYNPSSRTYYNVTGTISGSSGTITVPSGYGCGINIVQDRAFGQRNMYDERDPLNPIFEISKKGQFLLEFKRVGVGSQSNEALGSGESFKRMPPQ